MGLEGLIERSMVELQSYVSLHAIRTRNLGARWDEINKKFHRNSFLAVVSTELDMISISDAKPAAIEKFYHQNKDHGVVLVVRDTKPDVLISVYRDRLSMAMYLT